MTARTWPENTIPTPEQVGEWLGICTDEERRVFAVWALKAGEDRARCFIEDHDGAVERLTYAHRLIGESYQRGRDSVLSELREAVPWLVEDGAA